ncbi:aminotransferase class I/II-fold pyridoxal phosphate-dependent enzyme [Vibrio quintilis]|uniref:dTDP-4-amino-4,6-dideoxy-D-glucose transaminase n=1 Tax=Vibrio quintilis TaxID=1117707 RepID=A0A1M7YVF0_9VIBR|nr:aminotransferase class I/II-fold pyridoxal phosphate-dependent enzyme [Vibrio quintilis]SHO56660.1 dTDP-4-amino-4,6-dideoxy-D-glucose transaminase [Vibrio quintilis]
MKIYPRYQPDIQLSDFCATLSSYLTPLNRLRLENDILSFWQHREHVTISFSVRTAFDSLLTAMDYPENSEILMSAINIKDMVQIVESHHLKVVPVDLQIQDMSVLPQHLEAALSANTKVFVFAQLYGTIIDLKPIADLCKQRHILLIEDCAQAFCGSQYQGSPHADISLFSFGTIKSSTALGGAVVVARTHSEIEKIERVESGYPIKAERWFLLKTLKYLLLKLALSPVIYGLLIQLLSFLRFDSEQAINTLAKSFPHDPLAPQIRFRPPLHLLYLLRRRLQAHDDDKFKHRGQTTRQFLNKLDESIVIPAKHAGFHSFWVVPLLTHNPKQLQNKLLQHGFDSTQAKHSQAAIRTTETSFQPVNAAFIMDNVVYLPTLTEIGQADRDRLAKLLNEYFTEDL